jgi:hypothetical protein
MTMTKHEDRLIKYYMEGLKAVEDELPVARERGDAERVRKLEWLERYYNKHIDNLIAPAYEGDALPPWRTPDGEVIPF